ncbi:MAG: hypothetical protein F4X97_14490 [Boseongicola sp. SB0662_bin_57]|nr:hypothetical protein [Boseongicola sp. SB0662_bin_57]
MLVAFVLGLAAGWGASHSEVHARRLLSRSLSIEEDSIKAVELRAVALAGCVLLAAVASWLVSEDHAVPLAIGVLAGVLLPRLQDRVRSARAPDYDS